MVSSGWKESVMFQRCVCGAMNRKGKEICSMCGKPLTKDEEVEEEKGAPREQGCVVSESH